MTNLVTSLQYRSALQKQVDIRGNDIIPENLGPELFVNYNKNSDYVPFYSVLYKNHLLSKTIGKSVDSDAWLENTLNIFTKELQNIDNILLKSILKKGFTNLEFKYNCSIKGLLQDSDNKNVVKEVILNSLNNYIYQEPDLSIQLHAQNVPSLSNNNLKNYLVYFPLNNFVFQKNLAGNYSLIMGNYFCSTVDQGILACLLVRRDNVPLLRTRFLTTGIWDISLLEFWFKKEFIDLGYTNSTANIEIPKDNIFLVENFNNIFSINKHKTISEKKNYLKKEEDELLQFIEEGIDSYNDVMSQNKQMALDKFSQFGFELINR